jgi:dsDNA-specific endonuclease/ATPase MutS2
MARPIKETPELYGKDAERFEKMISQQKPVSKEERERARKAYEVMKSISNFQW